MKKIISFFLAVLTAIGCYTKNINKSQPPENNIEFPEDLDFMLIYTRHERSKDTNGSSEKFTLKNKTLYFEDKHWGFKSENYPVKKKSVEISDEDSVYIYDFSEKHKFYRNYEKFIKVKKKRSFTTFKYEARIITDKKIFNISVQSNDLFPDNKVYQNLDDLFYFFKRIIN